MTNEVIKCLETRRCVRKYKSDYVEEEKLEAILRAGTFAPSAMNRQPCVIVAIKDPKTRERLRKLNAEITGNPDMDPFYGAPIVIVVLAEVNPDTEHTYINDGTNVMLNMMNAAHSLGVSSCWVHRGKEEFELEDGKALLKEWGLSENYVGIANIPLGYCDGDYPELKPRKENYIIRV